MIGKIIGIVDTIYSDSAIVMVGGVGYRIFCSGRTLANMHEGSEVNLLIETHVREDHIHLYGFSSTSEQDWFLRLTDVQGVGNKVAMVILSSLSADHIYNAIISGDKDAFKPVSGVGPKLAARLITELQAKVGSLPTSGDMFVAKAHADATHEATVIEEAVSALTNLGYKRLEAHGVVTRLYRQLGDDVTLEKLLPESLKELSSLV